MAEDNDYTPPQASKGDIAYAVVRAGIGSIPVAGAAATELFNLIVTPPLKNEELSGC